MKTPNRTPGQPSTPAAPINFTDAQVMTPEEAGDKEKIDGVVATGQEAKKPDARKNDRNKKQPDFLFPQIDAALEKKQPVLLYFYSLVEEKSGLKSRHPKCTEFEQRIFSHPIVRQHAGPFLKLQVDGGAHDKKLLKMWRVTRVPTLLIIDHKGRVRYTFTITTKSAPSVSGALEAIVKFAKQEEENERKMQELKAKMEQEKARK